MGTGAWLGGLWNQFLLKVAFGKKLTAVGFLVRFVRVMQSRDPPTRFLNIVVLARLLLLQLEILVILAEVAKAGVASIIGRKLIIQRPAAATIAEVISGFESLVS